MSLAPGKVAAVVTAAGLGTRMGRPKALLDWRGRPLLAHQVAMLQGLGQVVVVVGAEAERASALVPAGPGVGVVVNPRYTEGRVSSLLAGFAAVEGTPAALLVVAVDQPLAPGVVEALLAHYDGQSPLAVPAHQGRRGHPVLFRGDLLAELRAIREDTEGLRAVVHRHRGGRQEIPVSSPSVTWDLNTPDAWLSAQAEP